MSKLEMFKSSAENRILIYEVGEPFIFVSGFFFSNNLNE